jgi:hypothetical protein
MLMPHHLQCQNNRTLQWHDGDVLLPAGNMLMLHTPSRGASQPKHAVLSRPANSLTATAPPGLRRREAEEPIATPPARFEHGTGSTVHQDGCKLGMSAGVWATAVPSHPLLNCRHAPPCQNDHNKVVRICCQSSA